MQPECSCEVSTVACNNYSRENIITALKELLAPLGGLTNIKPGMTVGIKANLVSAALPGESATTHPMLICCMTELLTEAGANVIIGDSPGGLYNIQHLSKVYETTGMKLAEEAGAKLNDNFGTKETENPSGVILKSFTYTSWLDECDFIINFSKLKTHGMMGMSAAAKNMFGTVPGIMKPEYHYRFPNLSDFSNMIIDLDEYFSPMLCICDAIDGMEGNGPTKGTPRHIGCLLASHSPHKLDLIAADIIGLTKDNVPTLSAAYLRGLVPDSPEEVITSEDYKKYCISDYKNVAVRSSLLFDGGHKLRRSVLKAVLSSRPKLKRSECVGCGKCKKMCPAKAIEISKNKKAEIDRNKCIRCFCCQEFCPVGAMKVHRTFIAKMMD